MAYGDFKDLLIKYYVIKHFILLKMEKMMDIKEFLFQWSISFLIKKTSGSSIKNKSICNRELAKGLI